MATIVLESDKVIAAAEKTIAHILAKRMSEDDKTATKWMQPRRTFWGKVITRTREEAIKALDENAQNNLVWKCWRSRYAGQDLAQAKALIHLAKQGNPVTLNEDDARVLF